MAEPGDRIADRYELVSLLGEGGMGVVWRARDARLGRAVAVKVLSAASIGSDTARARLIREARAAAALEHEGIIRIYDAGELPDGGAYLVMELVRGRSLRDELEKGPLSPGRCVRIVTQVARALQLAHDAGLVHRDIKPDNIMLRDDDRIMVVDFGVAKPVATEIVTNAETLAGISNTTLTGAGQIVGTPAYLSPEQARGPEVGAETDQFALAVTAFEAMTGRRPWSAQSVVEVVAAILRDPPPALRELVPEAPLALEQTLERALAKEPKDRFSNMNAFAEALEEAAAGVTTSTPRSARTPSGSTAPSATSGTVSTNGAHAGTPAAAPSNKRAALALVGVAALLVIAFFASKARVSGLRASTPAPSVASAEARLSRIVACPQFEVTGVDAPWLGAAAATLACERIQIARGGGDATTQTPAELAGARREVSPGFVHGIFDAPDSRDKGIAAARVGRWLDGKVDKQAEAYVVTTTLRAPDGTEIARGEGRALELFEAVRDALTPIVRSSPPLSEEERAHLREWLDVESVDDALALLDVRTAVLIEDPISVKSACDALEARMALSARALHLARSTCAKKLRTGALSDEPPAIDESTPGALITSALAQGTAGGPTSVRERAQKLEAARDRATLPEGKARLAAAAAEVYSLVGDERARDVARSAVRSSTKAVDWRSNAWHRIAFSFSGDASLAAAISTWHPWEPVAQLLWTAREGNGEMQARSVFHAYLLSRRGPYANVHGSGLLEQGDVEAARAVAELANDELLRVAVMLAEARYGAVLVKIQPLLAALPANDANAALAFGLAYQGVRASVILERPAGFVDDVVTRYVLSEPHHVVDGTLPVVSLVHACLLAPRAIGRRCIDRLEQLRRDGKLATSFSALQPVLAGASRFVADDYSGAAKSWRTLLRTAAWVQGPLREPFAIAFDRAGEPELAEEIEAPIVALVDRPRTAEMAWVRAARRAHAKGDDAQARKLARAVVEKWRFADEKVPAAQEMKDLLAKLPP